MPPVYRIAFPCARRAPAPPARGIVMVFTLIALTLLLVGIAALLRTVGGTGIVAGNVAFRRDLTNRAELAIAAARTALTTGAVSSEGAREADQAAAHYSASKLGAGAGGVPPVLLSDSRYDALYGKAPAADGVILRWVIDRQCAAPGPFRADACEATPTDQDSQGTAWLRKPGGGTRPVYRVTVRATGPRGTEAFVQTVYVD